MSSNAHEESLTPGQLTQKVAFSDLKEQTPLFILAALAFVALTGRFRSRSHHERKAARRLVRDWRKLDSRGEVVEIAGDLVLPYLKPALLFALDSLEERVHAQLSDLRHSVARL